jgi:hypothetical protein
MTANTSLERRVAEHYASEPPLRAPDRVLHAALATIETTNQRRGASALRRYPHMSTYTKLAAAVAVIAVGGFALWQLAPRPGGPGGPTVAPTATTVPTAQPTTAPSERPEPTTYVPGALTQTFTSDLHGVSLNYPEGWAAQAATEPWTEGAPPNWSDPTGDKVHDDAALQDHLFLTIVSRPLEGASLDEFFTGLSREECTLRPGGTINGADRVLLATPSTDCVHDLALASSGGRGYVFELRASDDDVELRTLDTAALLDAILGTVQLLPEDAVDE